MPDIQTLKVLTKFWADHYFRCGDDPVHGGPVGTEVKRGKIYTTVDFTEEELSNYLDDTRYYAYLFQSGEWRYDDDPALYLLGEAAVRSLAWVQRNYPDVAAAHKI